MSCICVHQSVCSSVATFVSNYDDSCGVVCLCCLQTNGIHPYSDSPEKAEFLSRKLFNT